MPSVMVRRRRESDFGERLSALRKERGLSQRQLAAAIGTSQRTISYYENEAGYPQMPVVAELARALGVTSDELLGIETSRETVALDDPHTRRIWKKFRQVLTLPEKDQRAVLRLVNSLVAAQERISGDA